MQETPRKLRILVAPLDWGLGHATRCIPIIRELLEQGCDVILAGEGAQESLLRQEFPALLFLPLEGYRVQYAKKGSLLPFKMLLQWPRLKRVIKQENEWLQKAINDHCIDAVISDNRYGLYNNSVPCVFITHQLSIQSPLSKWTEKVLQRINYKYINRFNSCWVPDTADAENLSGRLGHPKKMPIIPVTYIGWLSRFLKKETQEKEKHLLIILSGPEPQRTILEEKIIAEISHYNGTADVVRGLPGHTNQIPSTGMIQFYNHLPAVELNRKMQEAEYIISRSGYSTVMDIAVMRKKSILIPTPGQTEQEYLAKYLQEKKFSLAIQQSLFRLSKAILTAKSLTFHLPESNERQYLKEAVSVFLEVVRKTL